MKEGVWKGRTDHGTYEESYENGKLIKGAQQVGDQTYVYTEIESRPEFPGGIQNMIKHIFQNQKYPVKAKRREIGGTVFVEFVVSPDGSIKDVKTIKGIDPECDQEAERIVSIMPKWKPGTQRGWPLNVRFVLPIKFDPNR
jgi:TonB family protein